MVQRDHMPTFEVRTAHTSYPSVVERGVLGHASRYLPPGAGKLFIVTSEDIWRLHGAALNRDLTARATVLCVSPGEPHKRLSTVEQLANQMLDAGADRTSVVVCFGGGIVTDIGGFLAAIFMRGIPVLQLPTTLLAQVDAAVGGKTGVNLTGGKNLIGSFHQPLAVLIDPEVVATLPEREYRAGLFEVLKCAIICDPELFDVLKKQAAAVLEGAPALVDYMIASAVRIKAEVVSADERESDLRRILNFGHTVGHAMEAETEYKRFLHGETVGWGMLVAIRLAELTGNLPAAEAAEMRNLILEYGPLPGAADLPPDHLIGRLANDKKTLQGSVHFVLPARIGQVRIVSGIAPELIRRAIVETLR